MIIFITKQSVVDSLFQIQYSIDSLLEWMKGKSIYGVDTETTGGWNMHNRILSLQIGDTELQWVVDWQSLSREEKDAILTEMSRPDTTKVLQNAKFDLKFFFQEGHYLRGIFDVMVAECLIHAGKEMDKGSFALLHLAKHYAGMELDKSVRGRIHAEGLSNRVIEYAAQDVECLLPICYKQHEILQSLKMANPDHQDELTVLGIENRACLCLALMEFNGMKLDTEKWAVLTADFAKELVELEKKLDDLVFADSLFEGIGKRQMDLFGGNSTGINWKSPQQKLALLKRINPKIEDTAERSVAKHKHEHQLIPMMQRYIKLTKLYTGFALALPKMINRYTGRIHTSFWQNLKTGRMSTSDPSMLNIPARTDEGIRIRKCFIAEKGNKAVGGDLGQAELRIIAEMSQDKLWLETFRAGKDLHSELCAKIFNIPISDVKKESHFKKGESYRSIIKTLNFGLSYGMGAGKLADLIEISEDAAQKIINDFFWVVPQVEDFLQRMGHYAVTAQKAITPPPYRRIRWLPWKEPWERGATERQGKNHVVQGANADWIKLALGRIYYLLIESSLQDSIKPTLTIHDEIQTECREDLATWWKEQLERIMIESGQVIIKTIPVVVDAKIADAWEK